MASSLFHHVFSLPSELLDTLVPRSITAQLPQETHQIPPPDLARPPTSARTCNICLGILFSDVDQQRSHFRSDWHRYNLKMRTGGNDAISETQFGKLVDDLEESISGSASSDSDEGDAVATLVDKTRKVRRSPSPDTSTPSIPQTPVVWFHSPPATQIGIYKSIFSASTPASEYLTELKELQVSPPQGRTWAVFMTAGGHFAGAIVRVSHPDSKKVEITKKGKVKKPIPDIELLKHKTFHRYTTRRKQGGSQSLNDNAKSKAVSAGAMLRRYGEQALRDDIRNLLSDWGEDIEGCDRIWIRASVSNRRIFIDYEDAVIQKGDERLRTFPFPTRRPTQSELLRCVNELTRVKLSHLTEDALRAQDEAFLASIPKPKPKPQVSQQSQVPPIKPQDTTPKLTPEEEQLKDKWSRLIDIVGKGRLDALKVFWNREGANLGGIDTIIPSFVGAKGGTLLQVASHAGQEDVTRWILEDAHADPTIDVPTDRVSEEDSEKGEESDTTSQLPAGSRRTAYDIAKTRAVRNVFRRCAASYPDWWDWLGSESGARVQSVLTKEMEEGRDEKKKVRRKGLKDRIKEREEREKERDPQPVNSVPEPPRRVRVNPEASAGPRRLGGSSGSAEGVAGLTPEMRAKIERERRARAVEARLKSLSGQS